MVVDGDQALFAGRTAKATPAGVSTMIIDAISMESRYEKSASAVALAISSDTPFGQALPVLLGITALRGRPNPIVRGDGADLIAIPIDYDLESTLIIDWKVAEGYRPPYALEEEEEPPPPQPEQTPTEHRASEEGTIGRPTTRTKTGLYVMKGPRRGRGVGGPISPDSAILAVELTRSELAVVLPDGKRTLVRDPAAISEMASQVRVLLGRGPELVVTLTVAPDVPWSRYVDLLVATCRDPLVLINP